MATSIYVGNLSYEASEEDLNDLFGEFGAVASTKIIRDRETGRSRGFGFVEMESEEDAEKAIGELDGTSFKNRQLVVNKARPRKERPRRF